MSYISAVLDQMWIARWALASGLLMTVTISLLSVLAGTILGVATGLALTYGARPLYWLVRAYTDFVRGTPVLVLVLASYYVLSNIGLQLSPFQAGVLALAAFCSAHVGEIVRGALQAIPRGQSEAAKAIGLTAVQGFVYVLAPQALRQILPAWVNTAAEMVKASTLLSIIGIGELLLTTQEVIARNFMSLPFYFLAGFLYFAINYGIERLGRVVERKTAIHA